jgi:hypothetical protein
VLEKHVAAEVGHSGEDLETVWAEGAALQVAVSVVVPRLFAPKSFLTKFTWERFVVGAI